MASELSAWSSWAYIIIAGFVFVDAILPLVPSETILLAGGVLAADGDLFIGGVIATAAGGAFCGDLVDYRLGRAVGPRLLCRLMQRRWGRDSVTWVANRIDRHGIPLLISARFVPGGRTASTLTAGFVRFPVSRLLIGSSIGALIWATSQGLIGYYGGQLTDNTLVGLALAMGAALVIGLVAHLVTHRRLRPVTLPQSDRISSSADGPRQLEGTLNQTYGFASGCPST